MPPRDEANRLKHFINHELLAPNVLTVPVDLGIVREFEQLALTAQASPEFGTVTPDWDSDIRWISPVTKAGFEDFQSAFDRLDVARHVSDCLDLDRAVRLYVGFVCVRSQCDQANFHVDWALTNNEGFTLLTPLSGCNGQKLLYRKMTGEVGEYSYRMGEGIIFGDHFRHSTPPGRWDPPFAFLAFNFGTDKMVHWDKLKKTTGAQCRLIRQPDGELVSIDPRAMVAYA
ncbi:MAG: hypothetical protein V4502_07300 [Pseudomonadota bacterium]